VTCDLNQLSNDSDISLTLKIVNYLQCTLDSYLLSCTSTTTLQHWQPDWDSMVQQMSDECF